jgi:hypothetical protein
MSDYDTSVGRVKRVRGFREHPSAKLFQHRVRVKMMLAMSLTLFSFSNGTTVVKHWGGAA